MTHTTYLRVGGLFSSEYPPLVLGGGLINHSFLLTFKGV